MGIFMDITLSMAEILAPDIRILLRWVHPADFSVVRLLFDRLLRKPFRDPGKSSRYEGNQRREPQKVTSH